MKRETRKGKKKPKRPRLLLWRKCKKRTNKTSLKICLNKYKKNLARNACHVKMVTRTNKMKFLVFTSFLKGNSQMNGMDLVRMSVNLIVTLLLLTTTISISLVIMRQQELTETDNKQLRNGMVPRQETT